MRAPVTLDGLTQVVAGLVFPESPRWRRGELWFSDVLDGAVLRIAADGSLQRVFDVPAQPSGLGWLPAGTMLVVAMRDRRVLRMEPDGSAVVHAELAALAPQPCNDMVVDALGRAYVGNFGFDLPARGAPAPTCLMLVTPHGDARVVADGLLFPNGTVITPDGGTLIVAETFGARLTAFTIAADGSLQTRRTWADLPGKSPDGICLDAEGAVWVASPPTREVLRVVEGGTITHRVPLVSQAIACMLGGADGRDLFVLAGHIAFDVDKARRYRSGRIDTLRVEVPHAGLP